MGVFASPETIIDQIRRAAEMAENPSKSTADICRSFLIEALADYAEKEARSNPDMIPYVAEFKRASKHLWSAVRACREENETLLRSSLKQAAEPFKEL